VAIRAGPVAMAAILLIVAAGCSDSRDPADQPATATPQRVQVVSQNLLHGIACPEASDRCELPARVELFLEQLDAAGCPELVGVQEANERTVELLRDGVPGVCAGDYAIVGDEDPGLDREVVLTTLPVLGSRRARLAGPLRTAYWVRVAADVGVVDFVSTHLASSSDDRPCDATTCPPPCDADGMVNACQAQQVAAFADEVAADGSVVVIGGDLNARAGDPALEALEAAGFTDTHQAAGQPECDPATGEQCTSGRIDDDLTDLADPTSRQTERIDFLLLGRSRGCEAVPPTGLFAPDPGPPGAGGIVFASDHTGVEATIECATTEAQQHDAPAATVTTTATTAPPSAEVDAATLGAITEAFTTLFDGTVTDVEAKLAVLEDGELLRPYFLEAYAAQQAIAPHIRVHLDDVSLVDPAHAAVTYTLLLDGAAVLDHVEGAAVLLDGRWHVTRRTYCDVSTQGAAEIPAPCQ
jgi:endonuclease/exonuclease/phosphatase family metal-dependent hydrolase